MATFDSHANLVRSTVTVAPSPADSGTSLTLADVSKFPFEPFNCTVGDGTPETSEIIRVTGIVGNVLTILRAQEGTTARAILVGDTVGVSITVKTITDIEAQATPLVGAGSPEGSATADPGRVYWDTTAKAFYVKDSGSGNTGWYRLVG